MFKEYKGKQITRKAFEITSFDQILVERDARNDKARYGLKTPNGVLEFVAHERVNVGDFVVYLNDKDIYHCNRKVFLERNEYPSNQDHDVKVPMSAIQIEEMMEELKCDGNYISCTRIIQRIDSVDFQTIDLAGQKLMYCGIRMKGGFVVVGKPATCIDPSNWRDEIGKKVSFENSFEEIFKLEAYLTVEGK